MNPRLSFVLLLLLAAASPVFAQEQSFRCSETSYLSPENETFTVTILRSGDLSGQTAATFWISNAEGYQRTWAIDVPFAPGEDSAEINVFMDDDWWTGTQHNFVNCKSQEYVGSTAPLTLLEDEPFPTMSIPATAAATEGNSLAIPLTFVPELGIDLPMSVEVIPGTATQGADFDADTVVRTSSIWGPPEYQIYLSQDNEWEPNETFTLVFEGSGLRRETVITIIDDDEPQPRLNASSYEFHEPVSTGTVTVERPGYTTTALDLTLSVVPANGATWQQTSFNVHFNVGQTTREVPIPIDDNLFTGTRTASLQLRSQGSVVDSATISVSDDETMPELSMDDVVVREGAAGTTKRPAITLKLTGPAGLPITVELATQGGTASQNSDYGVVFTPVTIPAGAITASTSVVIMGDSIEEPEETFQVKIVGCCGGMAKVVRSAALCTIQDDDGPPTTFHVIDTIPLITFESAKILPVSISRSGTTTGPTDVLLRVTPSVPAIQPVIESVAVPFAAAETYRTVNLSIDDSLFSGDRGIVVELVEDDAIVDQAAVQIVEDEPPPVLTLKNASAKEQSGASAGFVLSVVPAYARDLVVDAKTTGGSAQSGKDFKAVSDRTTVRAGRTSATFEAVLLDDKLVEEDEQFTMTITATPPEGGAKIIRSAVGTIVDDDSARGSLGPDDEWIASGTSLELTLDTGAPMGSAASVAVESSDPSIVSVPISIQLAAGWQTGTFQATGHRRGSATLTATLPSGARVTADVLVFEQHAPVAMPQIVVAPVGTTDRVWVTLIPASSDDVLVTMRTLDAAVMSVDGSIVIPAGGTVAVDVRALAAGSTHLEMTLPQDHGATVAHVHVRVVAGTSRRRGVRH